MSRILRIPLRTWWTFVWDLASHPPRGYLFTGPEYLAEDSPLEVSHKHS